jgi:hypothetical protein
VGYQQCDNGVGIQWLECLCPCHHGLTQENAQLTALFTYAVVLKPGKTVSATYSKYKTMKEVTAIIFYCPAG